MEPIKSELELIEKIKKDIIETNKQNIKIFTGHFPLLYFNKSGEKDVGFGVDRWGEFSTYTFDLGCKILKYIRDQGKDCKLLIVVDDDIEIPVIKVTDKIIREDFQWSKGPRRRLYNKGKLPQEYKKILDDQGLSDKDIIFHKRDENISTPLISEKILKRDAKERGVIAKNECALAYQSILLDNSLFNLKKDYLVGFIPGQCKGSICSGVLEVRDDLDATHVFFPHIEQLGGLLREDRIYKKVGKPDTIKRVYAAGQVTYYKSIAKR
ncbi:hypothetical protein ACFLZJ_01845 [Nanoarchaeota archaeon]